MATQNSFKQSQSERRRRTFSEEFKRSKVREIEQKISRIADIVREYEVSDTSVIRWLHKYSSKYMKGVKTIVEAQSDTKKLLELKGKIAELEKIIGQKQVLLDFKDKMIDLAEQTYGVDIKKKFHRTLIWFWQNRQRLCCSLNMFYQSIGTSKQNIHQLLERSMQLAEVTGNVLVLVEQIRLDHPTMSCRAMYYKLKPLHLGRDNFEKLCKIQGYGIEPLKSLRRTTDSNGVIRFDNLLAAMVLTAPNQAWSSDITYFEIKDKFYYITFILDCYSRIIVGHKVSRKLETIETTMPALEMAIKKRKKAMHKGLVFHSDGGGQYYAKSFLKLTVKHNIQNSMCEYAYENGKAERINGTIKNNYLKHFNIDGFDKLKKGVDRAVQLYNTEKPHKSLQYKTPEEYEKKWIILQQQTKPTVTESLDAEHRCKGASSPFTSKQTKPPAPDVLSAINAL